MLRPRWVPFALALAGLNANAGVAGVPGWETSTRGNGWQVGFECEPGSAGTPEAAVSLRYPAHTESQPGDFVQVSRDFALPAAAVYTLSFGWRDDFTGPTAGHHMAHVLVDDVVVWESDVAGGDLDVHEVRLPATAACVGRAQVTIALRLYERRRVTNFGVCVQWRALRLQADDRTLELLPAASVPAYEPLPPDLPRLSQPPREQSWLRSAVVLQPWGGTQYTALTEPPAVPQRLAAEYGFNAVIVLPPEAHNAITAPAQHLSDAQFEAGVAAYREAGFRLILYSSIMHCGHAPVWQTGQLTREHPEWSQRDVQGQPITLYGHEWLCPSTPALEYTIGYTVDLVRRYRPSAVMLDNNQFYRGSAGPTCYCAGCQRRFREYVDQRFGATGTRALFGVDPAEVVIPTASGPLFNLWLHWRNRVWAEATETFRRRLREVSPTVALFANTQYLYSDWVLATDLQYEHEDMLLSESRGQTGAGMSEKLLLGRALAHGRPLWNYIGTFEEGDFTKLRAPEVILDIVSANLAHLANPWIVYYGFGEANRPALGMLSRLMHWRAAQAELFADLIPAAPVAVVLSPGTRNLFGSRLIPVCLGELRQRGVPATALSAQHLDAGTLAGLRVLVLPGVRVLDPSAAAAISAWVRDGGTLVASLDSAWYDDLGRLRPTSLWADALGVPLRPGAAVSCGKGQAIVGDVDGAAARQALGAQSWWAGAAAATTWEIVPYRGADDRLLVHLLDHGATPAIDAQLRIPVRPGATAAMLRLLSPLASLAPAAPVEVADGCVTVPLRGLPRYAVIEVRQP